MIRILFDLLTTSWCAVSLVAFFYYKFSICDIKTYGEAIRFCTIGAIEMLLSDDLSQEQNTMLYLTNQEVLHLVDRLKEIFQFPKLYNWYVDPNGVLCVEITAIELVSKYKDIDRNTLCEIVCNITQTYYMEIRQLYVSVFIPIATKDHVLIKIPLSKYAQKILMDNQSQMKEEELEQYEVFEEIFRTDDNREEM